jgi:hypothetical protein
VASGWASCGPSGRPPASDLLTLWATAPDAEDRRAIAETVLDRTADWEAPDVGLLWHAVALEQLVTRLTRPDRLGADFARARLTEARRLASDLGT